MTIYHGLDSGAWRTFFPAGHRMWKTTLASHRATALATLAINLQPKLQPNRKTNTMQTVTLAHIKQLARRRTPSAIGELKQIAAAQRERRDVVEERDVLLNHAAHTRGKARVEFLKEARMCSHRLARLPAGNRTMRRLAERESRRKARPVSTYAVPRFL